MDHTNGYGFTTSFVAGDRFRPSFLDTSYPKNKTAIDYLFVNHSKLDVLMKTKVMDFEPVTTDGEKQYIYEKIVIRRYYFGRSNQRENDCDKGIGFQNCKIVQILDCGLGSIHAVFC